MPESGAELEIDYRKDAAYNPRTLRTYCLCLSLGEKPHDHARPFVS